MLQRTATLSMASLALAMTVPIASADEDSDDENEIPFAVTEIYFELNDTDGDLGIHALIDGEPWKLLELEGPDERDLLKIAVRGRLRRQGLTELFFESAEPGFDELEPERFFRRFREGVYEASGITLEGDELESTAAVTHLLPAPPVLSVSGIALPLDCDEDPVPAVAEPLVVSWPEVTHSHPTLGRTNEPIEVVRYQAVIEREEPTALKFTVDLAPDVLSLQLPSGLVSPGEEIKVEVLVRESSGNQTATESCFEVE